MDCQRLKQLSNILILWGILFIWYPLLAEELLRARVTADRVNVRIRPDINSEIVTQLSSGEEVIVLERGDEWTKIKAPIHTKCWVYNECIEGDRIKSDSVNMRCGPGIAFPVLARLKKGTQINIIEVFGEWTRISPPVEFPAWVSSKYLQYLEELQVSPVAGPLISETTIQEQTVRLQEPEFKESRVISSISEEEIGRIELVSFAGRLEDLGVLINRPGTYKLVDGKGKWLCIIKSPTLDINPYIHRSVRIEGVVLSKSSSWGVPVIELKRLSVIR